MVGCVHCSVCSHAAGGKFGALGLTPVDTVMIFTPAGTWFVRKNCESSGTSRRQCGHQCATNSTSFGDPSLVMVIGAPSKACPCTVGASRPTAASTLADSSNAGNGAPSTVTGRVACRPASVLLTPVVFFPPPPERLLATMAMAATSTTAPMAMATTGTRRSGGAAGCALGAGRPFCDVVIVPPEAAKGPGRRTAPAEAA